MNLTSSRVTICHHCGWRKIRANQEILWALLAASLLFSGNAFASDWGYDGQTGVYTPEDWGHVSEICGDGQNQSPIDINTRELVDGSLQMEIKYDGGEAEVINNGHAVTAYNDRYITINGRRYELVQFHFHTLSEHTVNGKHYDMEMHLVHADADMNLAVIGVFLKEGRKNEALAEIFENLPQAEGHTAAEAVVAKITADYTKLLPRRLDAYIYSGSLTTPPCSEGVAWHVLKNPIELSSKQIEEYRELFEEDGNRYDTNRPVQALNGRVISEVRL